MHLAAVVGILIVNLSIIGCGPNPREKSLEKERDNAKYWLDVKSTEYDQNMKFAESFLELTAARENAWHYSNRYLTTPNTLLTEETQSENRRSIQESNDNISKLLSAFNLLVKDFRMFPPSDGDALIAYAKKISNASKAPVANLDAAIAKTREIKKVENENLQEDSERMQAMSNDEKAVEVLNFVKRDAALDGLIKNYESIKEALPLVVCATFAAQCKD